MHGGKMKGNGHRMGNLFHLESSKVVEQVAPRSCKNLVIFNIQLDKTLSNLVWSQSCPCFQQEGGLETCWGTFLPKLPYGVTVLRKRDLLNFLNWKIVRELNINEFPAYFYCIITTTVSVHLNNLCQINNFSGILFIVKTPKIPSEDLMG